VPLNSYQLTAFLSECTGPLGVFALAKVTQIVQLLDCIWARAVS